MTQILLLALGLALLFIGGELLLRGSVALASNLRLSRLFIGVFIVGFGTSLPELVASAGSALKGAPDIALGNVVGSNIANILLIVGLAALLHPIAVRHKVIHRDVFWMLGATLVFIALCWLDAIRLYSGLLLIVGIGVYLLLSFQHDRKHGNVVRDHIEDDVVKKPTHKPIVSLLITVVGLLTLLGGADLLVDSAIAIARAFDISELVIGLSVVAIGTSLPEVAMAVVSSLKKESDVIIGNIVGSNIFNLLLIVGVTSSLEPIPVGAHVLDLDVWVMLVATVLLAALLLKQARIGRAVGVAMLCAYSGYMLSLHPPF